MDSWEPELFNSGAFQDDVLANEQLLDNIFDNYEQDDNDTRSRSSGEPRRATHQRHQSTAHTMQHPLYETSHFDFDGESNTTDHQTLDAPIAAPIPMPVLVPETIKSTAKPQDKDKKRKDKDAVLAPSGRRRISKEQTQILEESFKKSTHLDKAERERVCQETGLMAKNVNIWFQNRRQKLKSQLAQSQEKPDIVGFFASRDDKANPSPQQQTKGLTTPKTKGSRNTTPLATPQQTPYRTPNMQQKRNSAGFLHGSPNRDRDLVGIQKQLMSPAIPHEGYFGLGLSNCDTPGSPNPAMYSPTSTLGEYSPAQPFPQYMQTPKQPPTLWESPMDQQFNFTGRASPPRMGRRGLMQSPSLVAKAVSSPTVYKTNPSQAAINAALSRSKSAAEIAFAPQHDMEYPELKRRRSNFGKYPTLSSFPRTDTTNNSTAANSAQVSPSSSPPTERAVNTPFDAIGAAQAQRMMATRTRSYTQPSLRYDSGVRLHLDDSNHQAVLVMVDQGSGMTPGVGSGPASTHSSTSSASGSSNGPSLGGQRKLSSNSLRHPSVSSLSSVTIPPPMPQPQSVSPQQYMLENSPALSYEPTYWLSQYDEDAAAAPTSQDESQYFTFPSSDT